MMEPKACKYCGFVGFRLTDEDCPAKPKLDKDKHKARLLLKRAAEKLQSYLDEIDGERNDPLASEIEKFLENS
jgi:hypothetical protein